MCSQRRGLVLLVGEVVAAFAERSFAVFDGLLRASADTGHTMGAVAIPYRTSVLHADVVEGTALLADAATHTAVEHSELFVFDDEFEEEVVHNSAEESVAQVDLPLGEPFATAQIGCNFFNLQVGTFDNGLTQLGAWSGKHCNVILRHHYLYTTHTGQSRLPAESFEPFVCISEVVAAGHYEIGFLALAEMLSLHPFAYYSGQSPAIGRRNKNQGVVVECQFLLRTENFVERDDFAINLLVDFFGDIGTVSCARVV